MQGSWNFTSIIPITLSFLYFISNFEEVFPTSTRHMCRPEQRDTLLEFKKEFTIDSSVDYSCYVNGNSVTPHPKTESWAINDDCCSWEGITCNAKSGEVIELDLSCSYLQGQFHSNSSLQNLHSLITLDFSYNSFSGPIPSFIGNLSLLTSLSLFNNKFQDHIPSSIGNLFYLTSLDLSQNHFYGHIPSSIGNLSFLTSLDLSSNIFEGQIPSTIGNLSNLNSLDLSKNNFQSHIPSSIGNLSNLTSLYLWGNQLFGHIPSSIGNLYKLTSLELSMNSLVGEIPLSFGKLNQLTTLSVFSNELSGRFPITLLNLTRLSSLSLYENQFRGTLPPNISSLSNLTFFDACDNAFYGTLPSSLFTIPSLGSVCLSNNQLDGTLDLGNISSPYKLQKLQVGGNNFRGPIPSSISKLTNLGLLVLSHYNTEGPVDFSIFSHLKWLIDLDLSYLNTTTTIDLDGFVSHFQGLIWLDLSGNYVSTTNTSLSPLLHKLHLSGCGITKFPEFVRTQHSMASLDISNNKIKGQVPGWLWTLPRLQIVDISNNSFNTFEKSAKPLVSLSMVMMYLFGSNNNFTGEIPTFICEFPALAALDLSNNNFNGLIPSCMGQFSSSLSYIKIRGNRLHGDLPENISERLRSLDIGHNQLTGRFPRSWIHLTNLQVLNVENNKINDTFPFWLSSLPELKVLVLRSNTFHGPIHQASFPKLQIIDISRNHFNGTLPSNYFMKWNAMSSSLGTNDDRPSEKYMGDSLYQDSLVLMNRGVEIELTRILKIYTALDFSRNNLEGEIPRSIGALKKLRVLSLSNNAFTGHIPSSMGNLTTLESLDVSQNQLSGEIPQELGSLSFLAYMNFSHNQFSGPIPGGTQFRTQKCSSFEDNKGLLGPALEEVCREIHTPPSQEMPESEEEEEEVLSWIAVAVGTIPGIVLGLTIGYILDSYKPKWSMNRFGRDNRPTYWRGFLNGPRHRTTTI